MIDSETRRWIEKLIDTKLNIILHGTTGETTTQTEIINNLFPNQQGILPRPVVQPYGFSSRAAQGTISVVGRVGEDNGNRMVLGHRDNNQPDDLDEGESAVYSLGGYQIRCNNGMIQIGKSGTWQTLIVGEDTMSFFDSLIEAIVQHTHIGNLGAPTSPPQNASSFTQLQTQTVDSGKLLCKDGGKF